MASIEKRGDSYRIIVSDGMDHNRRQIKKYMTWKPDPDMTEKQIKEELNRQAVRFEDRCKGGTRGGNIRLKDFIEDQFFPHYAEKQLKPRTLFRYRQLAPRVIQGLGHIPLEKLQPRHLIEFYENLSESGLRADKKYRAIKDIRGILKTRDIKAQDLAAAAGLGVRSITQVLQGRNVSNNTAVKVSGALSADISDLFEPVGKSSGELSPATQRYYHAFLSSVLTRAVKWQYIESNPCQRVDAPKAMHQEARYMDEKEAAELLRLLDQEDTAHKAMIYLLIFSGMRRGELCALTWEDIDFSSGTVTISKAAVYIPGEGIRIDTPKTESSIRSISVPRQVIDLLREHRAEQNRQRLALGDKWQRSDTIFTTWDGRPKHPDSISKWFRKFTRENNLDITLHSLRHTSATLLISAGTDIRTVSERLGHAQTSTTLNIYSHAIKSADQAAAETLANVLDPKEMVK